MPRSGLGRPRGIENYKTAHQYLNEYVLKVKDALFLLKEDELKKRKIHLKAEAKVRLQNIKLEKTYEDFYSLDFRKYGVDIPPRLKEVKKDIENLNYTKTTLAIPIDKQ